MITTGNWHRTLVARFGKPRDFDPAIWEGLLDDELGNSANEAEIIATLTWMQSAGQKWKPPAVVGDLVCAIRTRRKSDRLANNPSMRDCACPDCRDGWADVWPELPDNGNTPDDYSYSRAEAVPCRCAAGERLMVSCVPYSKWNETQRNSLSGLREKAGRQARDRRAVMTGGQGGAR